jgi:hypothetical protein
LVNPQCLSTQHSFIQGFAVISLKLSGSSRLSVLYNGTTRAAIELVKWSALGKLTFSTGRDGIDLQRASARLNIVKQIEKLPTKLGLRAAL